MMKRSAGLLMSFVLMLMFACSSTAEMAYLTGLTEGSYHVSRDLPAGLYTYTLSNGETGCLSVEEESGSISRTYALSGPASVTLYLPNKADITLQGQGILSEMTDAFVDWSHYEGTGRFLCGRQLSCGIEYQIRRLEGESETFYSIGSIRSDRGLTEETGVYLEDDEWHSLYLNADEFLFIRGCALQING